MLFKLARLSLIGVSFGHLRVDTAGLGCKDARDHIYGVMAILGAGDNPDLKPDYTKPIVDVYREVVVTNIAWGCNLKILEECELASLPLPGLPTWVPDFSGSPFITSGYDYMWSASAWISAHIEVRNTYSLRVAAVRACVVKSLSGECGARGELYVALREAMKGHIHEEEYVRGGTVFEAVVGLLGPYADQFERSPDKMPTFATAWHGLSCIKQGNLGQSWPDESSEGYEAACDLLAWQANLLTGRCFFWGDNRHVGVGPSAARPGDVVCVILGMETPMVLRRAHGQDEKWLVVGSALVAGLMHEEEVDGRPISGMWNSQEGIVLADTIDILRMKGFQAEYLGPNTPRLVVDLEELRAKGVKVEHFDLI
ncbi:hypothetical protein MN608_07461 [Microdochium nivale]|nr:hypothetical protein MN608_07461 [Microdochium nivale]